MGKSFLRFTVILLASSPALAAKAPTIKPADYVSPNIGGIGQLLTATLPFVQVPYGMARLVPVTTPDIQDRYLADKLYGFSPGVGMFMVSTGKVSTEPSAYASDFDHDFETAKPYYYAVDLQTWASKAEYTATQHAGFYRFTLPASPSAHISLSLGKDAEFTVVGQNALQGSQLLKGSTATAVDLSKETRLYFYAEFSRPFSSYQTWRDKVLQHDSNLRGDDIGFVSTQSTTAGEKIEVRVGLSYISAEQAKRNLLLDAGTKDFEALKATTRAAWDSALGQVKITGATERQNTIFYTALWRSLCRMTDISEDGHYYSGFDHAVHNTDGHDFYVDDGLWDTFRSMHPLQLLLDGHRQEDMIRSYLRMYQQSGWIPSFPSAAGEQAVMIGHHADQLILDTYNKGYRDFDLQLAYEGMRKNATEATLLPWARGGLTSLDHVYFDKGFFPALSWGVKETVPEVTPERRQAVSVTLETAYDDWAVAEVASLLGKKEDEAYFTQLAHNYHNLWNPVTQFMSPKDSDGRWVEHFDPKRGGGPGGRDYTTEMDSWIYTFSVQHDPQGLIQLMGGRDAFNVRLDHLFVEQYGGSKYSFLAQFPDATGLVGLYAQGNEPSFHVPYLYDFSGQPWKAQRRIRQLLDLWYGDSPLGIPGDDDGGETSSWYVLSSLGFYPECPGSPVYEIASPIFASSSITMGNDKVFTVIANRVSAQNKYIQFATLNGKPWNKPWFAHADIAAGGELVLEMGSQPNMNWGSLPQDAPPSMTPIQP